MNIDFSDTECYRELEYSLPICTREKKYPELKNELKLCLKEQMNKHISDFKKRAIKILREIEQ